MIYKFDSSTPPKEIINSAMLWIAELMKNDGFRFLKSKLEVVKKTNNFVFVIRPQSNRYNMRGEIVEMWLHCAVYSKADDTTFWYKTLASSNAKQDQFYHYELFPQKKYEQSLQCICKIISLHLLPFFRRFEIDLANFVDDVAENGFCAFAGEQVYDANYYIPINFLLKYGTKEHLNTAFQNYIDRHLLDYVKPNMKMAMELLASGKEIKKNGEKEYAEIAVQQGLNLIF